MSRAEIGRHLLRVWVALQLVIHGTARTISGGVAPFGEFLDSLMPLGSVVAVIITVVEITGGLTLAAGRLVPWLCAWFSIELAAGIALVHAPRWFVVGLQRNGMEYSLLLIAGMIVIALQHPRGTKAPG